MLTCGCCADSVNVPHTIYVKFHGLTNFGGFPTCSEPCESLSAAVDTPCFELTRTGACRWEGQITQNATCFPTSTMAVEISCTASTTTLIAVWIQGGGALTRYKKVVATSNVNCLVCGQHLLNFDLAVPADSSPGNRCSTSASELEVSFLPSGNCCQYCPSQYQITIGGIEDADVDNKCGEEDCVLLNAVYLLDFVSSSTTPRASGCADLATDWCEYASSAIAMRCTHETTFPHPYGYCTIHLFVKTLNNCTTELRVEIRFDSTTIGGDCTSNEYVGWKLSSLQGCTQLDQTFTMFDHRCSDTNWMCLDTVQPPTRQQPTIRVLAL